MPESVVFACLLATVAGGAIPLGAWLARIPHLIPGWLDEEFRHTAIAFGGGALLSAVALVLVPEGAERLTPLWTLVLFGAGGVFFGFVDYWLSRRGGHVAQFLAMMLDYLPEAAALGAMLAGDPAIAVLLAGLIAIQNLPEGFNAYREMADGGQARLWVFVAMVPLGPISAVIGLSYLTQMPEILGGVMVFSAGGILYLVFEDIAPHVPLARKWGPPLGAVAGFLVGLAGELATRGPMPV